jgi:hypothetical protein
VVQPEEQRRRLSALIQLEPAAEDDSPGTPGLLRRLCSALTHELPATWAGISLVQDGQAGGTVTGSDGHARELEDLQFDLGEGPCVDAVKARRPVLEADLGGAGARRWPAYAPALYAGGARGVFAFPLQVGAVCVGVLDIYQDQPEPMTADAVALALAFADLAMDMIVDRQVDATAAEVDTDVNEMLAPRLEVYHAQGMVMVDLGVSLTEAMALLRAHAFTLGQPLGEVAREVVAGRLRLEP